MEHQQQLPKELPAEGLDKSHSTIDAFDKSHSKVAAMFSQIATRYDLLNHLLSLNQDRRWRRRAIGLLAPRSGETVLDVCCGTGDLTFECLKRRNTCRVSGLDFALPMLRLARQKAMARGAQQATFTAGDALRLPFADASFDAVMVAFGVRNFEETTRGLSEMRRVLKPGGRMLVLEFMRPTSPLLRCGFGVFFHHVLPLVGRLVSRHREAYVYLPASVDRFYSRSEFEGLLRSLDLVEVRSFDYSFGVATAFVGRRTG